VARHTVAQARLRAEVAQYLVLSVSGVLRQRTHLELVLLHMTTENIDTCECNVVNYIVYAIIVNSMVYVYVCSAQSLTQDAL
jgi:hypothetical protein